MCSIFEFMSDFAGALPDYKRTVPSRNGGTPSGAAASKRAAAKRRNMRARSSRK